MTDIQQIATTVVAQLTSREVRDALPMAAYIVEVALLGMMLGRVEARRRRPTDRHAASSRPSRQARRRRQGRSSIDPVERR